MEEIANYIDSKTINCNKTNLSYIAGKQITVFFIARSTTSAIYRH